MVTMEFLRPHRFAIMSDLLLGLPIYLTSTGGWSNQERMKRKQGYTDFQWIQTINGQGELVTEQRILQKMEAVHSLLTSKNIMDSIDASSKLYDILLDLHVFGAAAELRTRQQYIEQLSPF